MRTRRYWVNNPTLTAKLQRQLKQSRAVFMACQGIGSIGFPLLEAVIINYLTGAKGDERTPFLYILVPTIISHLILFLVLITSESSAPAFLIDFEKQEEDLKQQDALIDQIDRQLGLCLGALEAIHFNFGTIEILQKSPINAVDTLSALMTTWVDARENIWGFKDKTLWNFVIYWVKGGDSTASEMEHLWRQNHSRLVPINRTWQKGDGHIGRCWLHGSVQVSPPDYIHSPHRQIATQRPEDDRYYQSLIAAPIQWDGKVYGVLIITSSEDGQFNDTEHSQITQILGMLIAQGLRSCSSNSNLFRN